MRDASTALRDTLDSGQFYMADLITLTLNDGTVYHYTNAPTALNVDGQNYTVAAFTRGRTRLVRGLETSSLEVAFIGPYAWAATGGLDGARLALRRAVMAEWGNTAAGSVYLFEGRVAELDVDRIQSRVKAVSDTELFTAPVPRRLYEAGCTHVFRDMWCGKTESYQALTILAGSTPLILKVSNLTSYAIGHFTAGVILFNAAPYAGVLASIRSHSAIDELILSTPLAGTPPAGLSASVRPGCDKTRATCEDRYNNYAQYGGFPFVPPPETML